MPDLTPEERTSRGTVEERERAAARENAPDGPNMPNPDGTRDGTRDGARGGARDGRGTAPGKVLDGAPRAATPTPYKSHALGETGAAHEPHQPREFHESREFHEDTGAAAEGRDRAARPAHETPLLPHDACDTLGTRLRHAVGGFVDEPRASVEEADQVLEEAAARFTDAVAERRRALRGTWHEKGTGDSATTDTEQLRLALRDYREVTERLLRL
ncbi:hypothetical protein ACFY93_29560 [Streptomyces sp. NPDC008313]|uniref:hypothetical protein n=1 Tax=Streptomyces sp. NPDC008313 TaxID=3364826 RepID=UPI0036E1C4E3